MSSIPLSCFILFSNLYIKDHCSQGCLRSHRDLNFSTTNIYDQRLIAVIHRKQSIQSHIASVQYRFESVCAHVHVCLCECAYKSGCVAIRLVKKSCVVGIENTVFLQAIFSNFTVLLQSFQEDTFFSEINGYVLVQEDLINRIQTTVHTFKNVLQDKDYQSDLDQRHESSVILHYI